METKDAFLLFRTILSPWRVFWLESPHPSGNSSLASYFPLKFLVLNTPPPPREISITLLGEGMDISWNHTSDVKYSQIMIIIIGRFQKTSVPYHGRLFGIPRARGALRTGNPKAWGDTYEWNSEGLGGLDLGFTQETDKNVFLESAFLWTF